MTSTADTDDIALAVMEDEEFFEEEVRIVEKELAEIKRKLQDATLSPAEFNGLHAKLREVYARFLTANDMTAENLKQHKEVLEKQQKSD